VNEQTTICSEIESCRELVWSARQAGQVGLVPTMGALHQGHLSLVSASTQQCDFTVVTVFVNPTQFSANEDLSSYPRPLQEDCRVLADLGVDLIFTPDESTMYPLGCTTVVQPPAVAAALEGSHRRTHFQGVTTIVTKLFNVAPAHVAYFGQKDYQQTLVIRRMVADLNLPIEIQVEPTIREPDGLALSSRNQYLDGEQRQQAVSLSQSLFLAQERFDEGESSATAILIDMSQHLHDRGVTDIDYVVLAHPDSLESVERVEVGTMALVAARVGTTRLIDNKRIE